MRRFVTSRLVVGFLPVAATAIAAPGAAGVAAGVEVVDAPPTARRLT